jgi:DoxX-like family
MSTSTLQSASSAATTSKAMLWAGRILTTLVILFLLFDAFGKFAKPVPVVDAFTRLGISIALSPSIGVLLLVCTILYAIPRTSVLGATLLTGYFGGAVAIHMRAGSTPFETVFPVIFGVLTWAGLYVRDCSLRKVFPIRR